MKPSELVKKARQARDLVYEVRGYRWCPPEAAEALMEAANALTKALVPLKVKAFDEEIGEAP